MTLPIYSALINSPMWYVSNIMDTFEWNHDEKSGIFYYGSRTHIYFVKLFENPSTSQIIMNDDKSYKQSLDTKIRYYMKAHHEYIVGLCTIPNGIFMKFKGLSMLPRFASCGKDRMIRVWSFNDSEDTNFDNICCCLKELNLSNTRITALPTCISINTSNNIMCGFEKGVLLSWNYLEPEISQHKSFYTNIPEDVVQIAWNKNRFAVGHKKGVIVIFLWNQFDSITKQTQFRAHNSDVCSVVWNPVELNLESWGDLATSGKDRRIKLWRVEKNFNLKTVTLPAKMNSTNQEGSIEKDNITNTNSNWVTLHWSTVNNGTLILTTVFGNLGVLKSPLTGEIKYFSQNNFTKLHSKSIFGVVEFLNRDGLLLSHSLDRMLNVSRITPACRDGEYIYSMPFLGGSVLSMDSVDHNNQLAVGCSDNMIRLWRLKTSKNNNEEVSISRHHSNSFEVTNIWNGINGKVLSISWHPFREGILAFGTENGHVGYLYVGGDKKVAIPSKLLHKSKVFITTWGKDIRRTVNIKTGIENSFIDEENDNLVVYTVGNYSLFLHDFKHNDFCDVSYLVSDRDGDASNICDFVMHESMRYFAVGYGNGVVKVFATKTPHNDLMQVCQIKTHAKGINCMKWCPVKNLHQLAVGSNERFLTVTDFRSVIDEFETTTRNDENVKWNVVEFNETLAKFKGHGDRITGLDWSRTDVDKLVSSSYDYTVFVWSIVENAAVVSFNCHQGRVLCCKWSNRDLDLVYTGGEDSNLFVWRPSEQKLHRDLNKRRNFTPVVPGVSGPIQKVTNHDGNEESETARVTFQEEKKENNTRMEMIIENVSDLQNHKKKVQTFIKKRSSLFPTTIFNVHHGLESYQNGVLNFVERQENYLPCLSLLDSRTAILKQIEIELEYHKKENNLENYFLLLIWVGKIGRVVEESLLMNYSPDWLVAIIFGFTARDIPDDLIKMVVNNKLAAKKDSILAATYWIAMSESEQAINVLMKNECFREALILAKLRLAPNHILIKELLIKLKDYYFKIGSFELSGLCNLILNNYQGFVDSMNRRTSKLANWVTIKTMIKHQQHDLTYQCAFNFVNGLLLESNEGNIDSELRQWTDQIQTTREISFYSILLKVHELMWFEKKSLIEIWNLLRAYCQKFDKSALSILKNQIQSKLVTKQINQSQSQISSYLTYEIAMNIIDNFEFHKIDIIDDLSIFNSINDLINQFHSITFKGYCLINQLIGTEQGNNIENNVQSIIDNLVILKLEDCAHDSGHL